MDEEVYWNDADFIRIDRSLMVVLGFSFEDIQALSLKGLPEWSAPNLNFDNPIKSDGRLIIGEDRNDDEIFVELSTLRVLVGQTNQFMNSNSHLLRQTLKLYAQLVDEAISTDENAFMDNRLPEELIKTFREKLVLLDPLAIEDSHFWSNELARLFANDNT